VPGIVTAARSAVSVTLGLLLALGLVLVSACSSQISGSPSKGVSAFASPTSTTSGHDAGPSSSSSSASGSSSPGHLPTSKKGGSLGATLEKIAVQPSEIAAGVKIRLIPGGADVDGEVTLDNCGFNFTTEAFRVARRQYAAVDSQTKNSIFSNELVAYDTAAHAAAALTEWHTAAATCPHTPIESSVADQPSMLISVQRNDLNVSSLPVPTNAITTENIQLPSKPSVGTDYFMAIFQVKGVFLDGLYINVDHPITADEQASLTHLATLSGQRLAQSS